MKMPTRHQPPSSYKLGSIITLGLAMTAQSAFAANVTWVGNTSTLWNVGTNWSTSAIPTTGDTLVFGNPGSSGLAIVDDIATLTVGGSGTDGIVIGPSAASYTISKTGTTLTLGSTGAGLGIKDSSLFLQTISSALVYGSAQTVQVGATTGAALSSMTLSGIQSGGFRLTKTGTGLLTLSAANTMGGLTINGGMVNIAADTNISTAGTASTASIIINGGTLRTNLNGAFSINVNRSILLGDATAGSGGTIATVVTNAGGVGSSTLTYNGVIANNGGTNYFAKTGTQILSLGGANTYTGETRIMQGQLSLDFTQATAPTSNIINSGSKLVMGDLVGDIPSAAGSTVTNSPILFVQGSNTVTTTQTFNGTAIHPGNANVVARGGTSTFNTTVELGALTHTTGGVVGFSLLSNGSSGQGVIAATGTSNTNGIIGGWATTAATVGTSGAVALTQTDWATVNGSNNIVAYTGYTVPTGSTPTLTSNAASNLRIDGTSTGNLLQSAGTTDLNTIQGIDTAARTITVGTGNTLRLGSFGGVWKTTAGNLTIGSVGTAGTLTAGGAANTAGEIVFNNATGAGSTTVNSVVTDNGTGAVSIVKTGTVGLTLAGNNSFSGGTYVLQGTLSATNANSFGGSGRTVTVLPGAGVSLSNLTYANNFNLAGSALTLGGVFSGGVTTTTGATVGGTVTLQGDTVIGSSGTSGTIAGKITGDYNLSVIGGIILSNATNDYSGNFGINGLLGPLGGNPVLVKLGTDNVLANGSGKGNVVISGSATAGNYSTLDLNGKTETINGLVSAGTVAQSRITNTSATAATLTLGDNDQTATYAGTIIDGTGTVAITKIGTGIQTFSGTNTYTGNTTITGGTLALSSTGSIANSPVITVGSTGSTGAVLDVTGYASGFSFASGQTVKGIGTIKAASGQAVTFASGSVLTPGNSIGTLAVSGNLVLASGSSSTFELGTTGTRVSPGTSDRTTVTGSLTLGGALTLSDNAGANGNGSAGAGSYKIFTQTGSATGSFSSVTNNITGTRAAVDTGTSGSVFVDVYNKAAAASSQTVNLKSRVNTAGTASVTIANTAATNATYTETLGTTGFSGTTSGFTATGSATGIAGGGSGSGSLSVGGTFAISGVHSGSTTLGLQTEAVNGSGLGTLAITGQTVNINVTTYDRAKPVISQASGDGSLSGSLTTYTLDFGTGLVAGQTYTANLTLTNQQISSIYQDALSGNYSITGASEFSQTGTSFTGIASTGTNSFSVVFTALSAGSYSGTVTLGSLIGSTSGLADDPLSNIDITLSAAVSAVPEPSTYAAIFGSLVLFAAAIRRRSRKSE